MHGSARWIVAGLPAIVSDQTNKRGIGNGAQQNIHTAK